MCVKIKKIVPIGGSNLGALGSEVVIVPITIRAKKIVWNTPAKTC